jgi:hypothetical protein
MNVSRDEATAALDHVEIAGERVRTWRWYAEASSYLVIWGCVWLVGNVATDLDARWGNIAWSVGLAFGLAATLSLTIRNARRWQRSFPASRSEGRAVGRRAAFIGTAIMLWFPTLSLLAGPFEPRQGNALISITWAFIYMAMGAFVGWRLFAIGLVTAAAIVCGYLFVQQHFFLWMGLVGGGSLIVGGLWLRKI